MGRVATGSAVSLGQRLRAIRHPVPNEDDGGELQLSDDDQQRAVARESAASALIDLARIERQPRPVRLVLDALSGRTPDIALFREADRGSPEHIQPQ